MSAGRVLKRLTAKVPFTFPQRCANTTLQHSNFLSEHTQLSVESPPKIAASRLKLLSLRQRDVGFFRIEFFTPESHSCKYNDN